MRDWKQPWAETKIIREEDKVPFAERVVMYEKSVERVIAAEKLITLVRGFVSGKGGIESIDESACIQFCKDFPQSVMDVANVNDPAYVFALAQKLFKK